MDKEGKPAAAEDFFLEMEKQARTGEKIVKVIVISSYVLLAVDVVLSFVNRTFSLLSLIMWILWAVFYYKLYIGRTWAKWLYVISSAIGIVFSLILLSQLPEAYLLGRVDIDVANLVTLLLCIFAALTVVRIVFCVLLIGSKSVKEFLYRQMAGG